MNAADCAEQIDVLVVDSNRMGAQLLSDAILRDERFNVVSACAGSAEALASAAIHHPQVAVVSGELDGDPLKGFELCRKLRSLQPDLRVVTLLDRAKRDLVLAAFNAAASGVFCRAESVHTLLKCIHSVSLGQVWANSQQIRYLIEAFADTVPPRLVDANGMPLLSQREQDVLGCVTEGLTNKEIAARLKLSEHTIKNYIFRIFEKLGVSTRLEVVLYALSQRETKVLQMPAGNNGEQGHGDVAELRKAAERGEADAQLRLGELCRDGKGIPGDRISAYMWFLLAERSASELARRSASAAKRLASRMARVDIEEAERRVSAWVGERAESDLSLDMPMSTAAIKAPASSQKISSGGRL